MISTKIKPWLISLARCLCASALLLAAPGNPSLTPIRAASNTLVITEVMYDPEGAEPDGEWIEIYNLSGAAIDLSGYQVGDEETQGGAEGMMQFPGGASLASGQVIVVANKSAAFFAAYGFKPAYELLESDPAVPNLLNSAWATGSVALANGGDEVLLLDPGDAVVDSVSWGSSTFAFNPSIASVAEGHSVERRPATVDTDTALNWIDQPFPAPGFATVNIRQVTSAADNGPGTLRQALLDATRGDVITFDPAAFPPGNPATILPQSALIPITTDNLTVDASAAGVILDGSATPAGTDGLTISGDGSVIHGLTIRNFPRSGMLLAPGAANNVIGGDRALGSGPNGQGNLIIGNGDSGVEIRGPGADRNRVLGNYIGVDGSGMWDLGNTRNGVVIWQGAAQNIVGGGTSGYRNVIGGNGDNGIWIAGAGTDNNVIMGNYLGTRADGLGPVDNGLSGVAIQAGAQNNIIGGVTTGAGNLISGNGDHGIYISDAGTEANVILGNLIGPDKTGLRTLGQGLNGLVITLGASRNQVGDGAPAGRNVISGNTFDGIWIGGSATFSNTVQGNFIGANAGGAAALPNGTHGVEVTQNAHDNLIGGDRLSGQGNLLSGNLNHGLVIAQGAHHNTAQGNIVGPDAAGAYSLGNHPFGGIDVTSGAYQNVIGGLASGEGNLISGNQTDGIALYDAPDNQVLGNLVGLTLDGNRALPNGGPGIFVISGAVNTRVEGNIASGNQTDGIRLSGANAYSGTLTANWIGMNANGTQSVPNGRFGIFISEGAHDHLLENNVIRSNAQGGISITTNTGTIPTDNLLRANQIISNTGAGIYAEACGGNTFTQNAIYGNALAGIQSACGMAPVITEISLDGAKR